MILLIAGASHTGKTALAQKLLEKYKFPYLSIDHLKMGLIRSGNTDLTPESSDEKLTEYLWNIVKEIIKTAVENEQNLIVEGCYIPFDWKHSFDDGYLEHIRCRWLIMSEDYIKNYFGEIKEYGSIVENRGDDADCTAEWLIDDNRKMLEGWQKYGLEYILIDGVYSVDWDIEDIH
ncbi:MAG: ATP-binding protein [Ruminiclostridium sp.]|nr:ATP-binding protein [Ruminiclostridium sp.]